MHFSLVPYFGYVKNMIQLTRVWACEDWMIVPAVNLPGIDIVGVPGPWHKYLKMMISLFS
jgi:hypothetical protein